MLLLALLIFRPGTYGDYHHHRSYQPLASTEFLRLPFAIDFTADGNLYVLDTIGHRVHVWDRAGQYLISFGSKGGGPGELAMPAWLRVVDNEIWVWGFDRRISKFDSSGKLLKTDKTTIRFDNFVALSTERCVAAYKNHANPRQTFATFQLTDGSGTPLTLLQEFPNRSYLSPPGDSVNRIKAFPPDHVIQPAANGGAWFGFSQHKTLYLVDGEGKICDKRVFDLPDESLTDEDQALMRDFCYPRRTGGMRCLADATNLVLDTSHNKAAYTDFIIRKGYVAFVLTPLGGMRSGSGYRRATFRINELASGKLLARGGYAFPDDAIVLHQRGRSIAFTPHEDGDYLVEEILLDGLPP